ncbi:hypothetical protein CN154_15170 [Sinorhizobium meliloti]|uniref:hypothetical protein n=1 Tax=Rhizobium meliloti TaxID=382 RepID=UPI000FE0E6F1|nr:hypothetical protein [Sinorhizobium meliloti]RVK75442.1 hypothetical protein CN154_15170 [Sinorhizobium meliloti]
MGKVHKRVWSRGKNLKPAPRGRTPVQAIPGPRPRSAGERRQKQEYQLAISKKQYPREELLGPWPEMAEVTPLQTVLSPTGEQALAWAVHLGAIRTMEQMKRVEAFLLKLFTTEIRPPQILVMDLDGELVPPPTVHLSPEIPTTPEIAEYLERVNREIREIMMVPVTLQKTT